MVRVRGIDSLLREVNVELFLAVAGKRSVRQAREAMTSKRRISPAHAMRLALLWREEGLLVKGGKYEYSQRGEAMAKWLIARPR